MLVGNSMGGGISMLEAALEPAAVEALVLSNSVFPWKRGSSLPAPIVMVGFALYELPRVGEWASRQRVTRLEAERAVELGLRIIAADPSTIPDDVVRWIVASVKCPVLVVHGREDRLVPLGFAMGALELRPDWDMRLIPKAGHVPQMEAPERWLAAVEPWLEGLGAG